jgi:hypothetical protein
MVGGIYAKEKPVSSSSLFQVKQSLGKRERKTERCRDRDIEKDRETQRETKDRERETDKWSAEFTLKKSRCLRPVFFR